MQPDSITVTKWRGCRPRWLNGVEQGIQQANKRQRRKKRKPAASRLRTELCKRRANKVRRARHKQLKQRLLDPLGDTTVRRRVKAVRYYYHWRQRLSK